MQNHELKTLSELWLAAKRDEDAARDRRHQIEKRLLAALPQREEGSQTVPVGAYKIRAAHALKYDIDMPAFTSICCRWPTEVRPLKVETKVDETKLRAIRRGDPERWALLSRAVTVRPAKVNFSILEDSDGV